MHCLLKTVDTPSQKSGIVFLHFFSLPNPFYFYDFRCNRRTFKNMSKLFSSSLKIVRKGLPIHDAIIDAYMKRMSFAESDKVLLVDLMPNRHGLSKIDCPSFLPKLFPFLPSLLWLRLLLFCFLLNRRRSFPLPLRQAEFARAVVKAKLERSWRHPVYYLGLLKDHQKDVAESLENAVYTSWDAGTSAPPKHRQREQSQTPRLSLILWQNGRPLFPQALLTKFAADSDQCAKVKEMQQQLEELWPTESAPGVGATSHPRAGGSLDLAGEDLLDIDREVSVALTPFADFSEERPLRT